MNGELDGRIHLWDDHGARAGTLTILPMGSKEATILELTISTMGLENFEHWIGKAKEMARDILLKQSEIRGQDKPSVDTIINDTIDK